MWFTAWHSVWWGQVWYPCIHSSFNPHPPPRPAIAWLTSQLISAAILGFFFLLLLLVSQKAMCLESHVLSVVYNVLQLFKHWVRRRPGLCVCPFSSCIKIQMPGYTGASVFWQKGRFLLWYKTPALTFISPKGILAQWTSCFSQNASDNSPCCRISLSTVSLQNIISIASLWLFHVCTNISFISTHLILQNVMCTNRCSTSIFPQVLECLHAHLIKLSSVFILFTMSVTCAFQYSSIDLPTTILWGELGWGRINDSRSSIKIYGSAKFDPGFPYNVIINLFRGRAENWM